MKLKLAEVFAPTDTSYLGDDSLFPFQLSLSVSTYSNAIRKTNHCLPKCQKVSSSVRHEYKSEGLKKVVALARLHSWEFENEVLSFCQDLKPLWRE